MTTFTNKVIKLNPSALFLLTAGFLQYDPQSENRGLGHSHVTEGLVADGHLWRVSQREVETKTGAEPCVILTKVTNPFGPASEQEVSQWAFPVRYRERFMDAMELRAVCAKV